MLLNFTTSNIIRNIYFPNLVDILRRSLLGNFLCAQFYMCHGIYWLHSHPAPSSSFFSHSWPLWGHSFGLNQSQSIDTENANGGPPGLTSAQVPGNGLETCQMGMRQQDLHMCVFHLYKREGSPSPFLTFWLTVVETTSQSMIPLVDTHQVTSSLNTIVVELSLPVDLPHVSSVSQ